ncbi:MAG: hypothetical protein HY606_07475 [Planctomycetes bacterium]|nr:hypothetical protein [Planctomycetota bacterium]
MSIKSVKEYLEKAGFDSNGSYFANGNKNKPVAFSSDLEYHLELRRDALLRIFRLIYQSRRTDDHEELFLKKGMAWFGIYCAGAEIPGAVAGILLRDTDPIVGYYRDRAVCIARGITSYEMFLQAVAAKDDPASGGHQMPAHFGQKKLAVISQTSATGSQSIQAYGLAEAIKFTSHTMKQGVYPNDSIVYTTIGDSSISEGEFYEAVKSACHNKVPLLIHIINNRYGISVPIEEEIPGSNIQKLFSEYPNLSYLKVDGTSVRDCYDLFKRTIKQIRSGTGPCVIESDVVRLYSHSASDDQRKYRPAFEIELEEERDPILKLSKELIAYGIASADELKKIISEVDNELDIAHKKAIQQEKTDVNNLLSTIYNYDKNESLKVYTGLTKGSKSIFSGNKFPIAESLNRCLLELMEKDSRIVMWGEDIADFSVRFLDLYKDKISGKGGVFGVTKGLQRKFGGYRVRNSPIAEATVVGKAIGYSLQGFLPIVEIQFRDYLNPAWQQLIDEVATMSYRSNGSFRCPMVIRMASGGYLLGAGAIWHSEMAAGALMHYPGIRVAVPSNPRNACGSMRGAIYSGDPVCYLEPKALYRKTGGFFDNEYPDFDYVLWPGEVELYGDGKDLLFIGYGNTSPICYEAMRKLQDEGIKTRFLNLVWLNPLNEDEIRKQAKITKKVLIVDEDRRTSGASSAIADAIWKDRKLRKEIDVEKLNSLDCRVSYGSAGEYEILPQLEDVITLAKELVR